MARCSFCEKDQQDVSYLVTGPRGVAICDECAALAHQVAREAFRQPSEDLLLTGISRLVTCDERRSGPLGALDQAAVAVRWGRISWVGSAADLPGRYHRLPELPCRGRAVLPGFVDPAVPLFLWDGRPAVPDPGPLTERGVAALTRMLAHGVTCVDLRAGGSGDPTIDTTLLAAARGAAERLPIAASITWVVGQMPGHLVERVMGRTAARLASAAELSCDGTGAVNEIAEAVSVSSHLPFRLRPCELADDGCAELASQALTVEGRHVLSVDANGRVPLVETATDLLAGTVGLGPIWERFGGCSVASGAGRGGLSLDGPGLGLALAIHQEGLTPEQALWSHTRGGALALAENERGRLRLGDSADLVILDDPDPLTVTRHPDSNPVWRVMVSGRVVEE